MTSADIKTLSEYVKTAVDAALLRKGMATDQIFLIGSHAAGKATENSDIDFLVQLRGGLYPNWADINYIHRQIPKGVHVIFGTLAAQVSMNKPFKFL